MYEAYEITEERINTFERDIEVDIPNFELGNSKLGIGVIMAMAAFVGVWGTTCLVSGLVSSGSMQNLGRGLLMAVTGM